MIIGLDVGGTHTDIILLGRSGPMRQVKVATDAADLFGTIVNGLARITDGIDPSAIRRAVLSTTLATNMVVQDNMPPVGMLVTGGPGIDPALYATGAHYHVLAGAMDHRGRETEPLDLGQVRKTAVKLKAEGIRHVGVVGKFSVRNPDHELAIARCIENDFERIFLGHQCSGSLNFPRRIATTYLNAAVYPVHKDFFEAIGKSLSQQGLDVPIRILKPDGGNMNFASSVDHPAQTIMSGPSASVMGAVAFAPKDKVSLVLDVGGTTTDMAVLIDGVPLLAPLGIEIGPYKTQIRALRSRSIGLGGDSVVRGRNGGLTIGPDRLGVAMAYGGPAPTPTDALFVLEKLNDGDRNRAVAGLAPLAEQMGCDVHACAGAIFEQACRQILENAHTMIERINSQPVYTVHELYRGSRIAPGHILVLGGPAAFFAETLATLFDGPVTCVPRWQVANAIGCALARTTSEVTLYADTARETAVAPGEHFSGAIPADFSLDDAVAMSLDLLRAKARRRGANPDHLEMEVIEQSAFNMVRGFSTAGQNIRVRAQVKPGLIHGYDPVSETMTAEL